MVPTFNNNRPVLIVDLARLKSNYRVAKNGLTSGSVCAGVVKANGYGLGAVEVARALYEEGCRNFFVAYFSEAIEIKPVVGDSAIYVFHGLHHSEYNEALAHDIRPSINSVSELEKYQDFAKSQGKKLPVMLHLDTGMGRLGLPPSEFKKVAEEQDKYNYLEIEYVMSHLACGEDVANPKNAEQLNIFQEYSSYFESAKKSLANSSGIFLGADYHYDLARPGCMLYGVNPTMQTSPVQQVAHLYGKVLQIRTLDRDQTVSYGAKYPAKKGSRIATISMGYADGYHRILTGNTHCFFEGHYIPLDIRITMDMLMFDVTHLPEALINKMEYVELLGDNITVDKLADDAKTIGYEILTSLGNRYNRHYKS